MRFQKIIPIVKIGDRKDEKFEIFFDKSRYLKKTVKEIHTYKAK